MHTLGQSFIAYAITPAGETIPLVRINDWDFNWQSTYVFREPLTIPERSIIYAEGAYDNTSNNPENPNVPPKTVTYGWNTTDEMMNLIMYYLDAPPVGPVRRDSQD
ncbi:MAG: cytochrome c, partial [Tunicatimonas sp.]